MKLICARDGDIKAREALVRENIALVKYVVTRFLNRGAEYEDLFQYGCLGLLKAIDRFDPSFEVQFSTYAVPLIMGEIRRYLRDEGPIHISRTVREQARRVEKYIAEIANREQRMPGLDEIATDLGLEREDVLLAMNSKNRIRSLYDPVAGDDRLRLMDVLGSETMGAVDQRLTLAKLLRDLEPEERALIVRRYFQSHTQTQIARDMGISQVQVSRLEGRILKHMRNMAGE